MIYNNLPIEEQKVCWIEGTTRRWDGYLYLQKVPQLILGGVRNTRYNIISTG